MSTYRTALILETIFFLIISLALIFPVVSAVSVTPSKTAINYEPGIEQIVSLNLFDAPLITSYFKGDLAPYAKIIDLDQGGGPRTITAVINLPEGLLPGRHKLLVGASEATPQISGSGVAAKAAILSQIYVDIPYPGVYIEATIKAQDINVGEKEKFAVNVANLGEENVAKVSARVEVLDVNNNPVAEFVSGEPRALGGVSDITFEFEWDSSATDTKSGIYKAVAAINYDGNELKTKEATFKIGTLNIEIKDYTTEFAAGTINPFFIEVQSSWNEEIKGVYGELFVAEQTFKTLTYDLSSWQNTKLTGYVDGTALAEGEYAGKIIVYYANKTVEKSDKIIVNAAGALREMPVGTETGKAGLATGAIVIMLLGLVFVAAIVMLVLIYVKRK